MDVKKCFIIVLLFSSYFLSAMEPVIIDENEIDGIYIGKHVKYLNEKDLFLSISKKWQADDLFISKIKSGKLSSDRKIKVKIENISTGYRAHLKSKDKTGTIEWGIKDILQEEVLNKFKQSENEILKINFIPHSYWLSFSVENTTESSKEVFLQMDKYLFNMMHLFTVHNDEFIVQHIDFNTPLKKRVIKDKKMTHHIKVNPGKSTFYLRVDNWFMDTVPLRLWSRDLYYQHIAFDNALLGIFAGIFLLVFLYNIFIFFFIKDKSYLYLSLMTLAAFINHIVVSGFGFQYFWPEYCQVGIYLFYSYFPLMMIFTLLFSQSFLDISRNTPLIHKFIFIIISVLALLLLIIYFVPFSIKKYLFAFFFIFDHIYYFPLIFSAFIAVRRKNRHGLFLLIALGFYLISNAEWILSTIDIIPYRFINYLNIKGVLFIIIMIVGLGYKIKIMRNLIIDYKIRLKEIEKKQKDKTITDTSKRKIEQVKEFLKENFSEIISREGLAKAVDMSPDHLGRIFKKDMGIKLSDYINNLRITEAVKQLENENTSIIDIAFNVGFESLRTFNKVFHLLQGKTPSEYRKKLEKKLCSKKKNLLLY